VKKNLQLPLRVVTAAALAAVPGVGNASLFEGETLDAVANALAWIILFIVPIVGIAVFWLVHILPEKIAEKKKHPQAAAIQVLCLLSLVFGGLLWPLAWLWAYSKPVMYKLAYGTDEVEHGHGGPSKPPDEDTKVTAAEADEVRSLRSRIAELEARLAGASAQGSREAKA
jgi:CBS domain containing-hemolysin-like protein